MKLSGIVDKVNGCAENETLWYCYFVTFGPLAANMHFAEEHFGCASD